MSNRTIRMIILLGAFVIVGIFIVQVYWLQKAFGIQDKQFDQSIRISLSNVSEALNQETNSSAQSIERLSSNYYVLHVNGSIDTSLLNRIFNKEFYNHHAEYGVYDTLTGQFVYGDLITMGSGTGSLQKQHLPLLNKGEYYIGISFPGIIFRMNGEMYIWIFSTFILLVFLVFFTYALFVILKQKRFSEVQADFVNNITHEFKTPLSTISLIAETLGTHSGGQHPQLSSFINIIKEESEKLNTQVDKILLSGKSKSLRKSLKKEKLDLHELIRETGNNLQPVIKSSIQLKYNFKAENSVVTADKIYIAHALQNLLDNAIKYSGDKAEVLVSTENKRGQLLLSVEDNGIGIDRKYSKKIFEPFFRIPTGNVHNVRGFGIGLHYVKNIVSAHHWKLVLSSEYNKGSKFTLQIPV